MKAIVITAANTAKVLEVTTPIPAAGEILIRVESCLLCTWEQRIFSGASMKLPYIAGHELSGVVEFIPDETITSFKVGDKVVAKTLDNCGHCEACYRGDDNQCTGIVKKRMYDGIGAAGGLAQYINLSVNRVFYLENQEVSYDSAAFSEPVACCLRSMDRAKIELGEDVVIVGAGIMGQLHNLLAKISGARTIIVEPDSKRRELALEMGADFAINPMECNAIEKIKELTHGRGAHVVFLTVTMTALAKDYLAALSKMGRMVYYGSFYPDGDITINPNEIHYSEKVITGSSSPNIKGFWTAAKLLADGLINVKPFISENFGIDDCEEAFKRAMEKDTYRVAINLWK
ncbi:MAG: zinc-binding dehydrogenase [Clostridia bacterium]